MSEHVDIDYTNWRGERSIRRIIPTGFSGLQFNANEWHPEPQWLLTAFDVERSAFRTFAMKDVHSWTPASLSGHCSKASGADRAEREAQCKEPWHMVDGVPYCDTCGLYRDTIARQSARLGRVFKSLSDKGGES